MGFSTRFKIIKQMLSKKLIFNALVSSLGTFLCISFLAFLNGIDESTLWLIPPFGASMVLVMSAHDSPLAQPKNIFFGHTLSALSGVAVYAFIGSSFLTIGIAIGLAIFVMIITKTVHPPAGGNPIIAVMASKSYEFIFIPVALGALIIIIFSLLYNKSIKREYPSKNIK